MLKIDIRAILVVLLVVFTLAGCMDDAGFNRARVGDAREDLVAQFGSGRSSFQDVMGVTTETIEYRGMFGKSYRLHFVMGRLVGKSAD